MASSVQCPAVKVKSLPAQDVRLQALEQGYVQHHRLVRAIVTARGVESEAIDDVVHDAFVAWFRRIDERPAGVTAREWLAAVARNVAFSHRRSRGRRRRRLARLPATPSVAPIDADILDARAAWRVVSGFLGTLPVSQREAFLLCELEGISAPQVGRLLGCSANTVGSRLRLARGKFARRFPGVASLADHGALLRAAAQGAQPSETRQQQALGVLLADVQLAGLSSTLLSLPKVVWAAAAAATLFGVLVVAKAPRTVTHDASIQARTSADESSSDASGVAAIDVARGEPSPRIRDVAETMSSPTAPPMTTDKARADVTVLDATPKSVAPSRRQRSPRTDAPPVVPALAPAAPSSAADSLAEELRLLRRAKQALDGGRIDQAQSHLGEHAQLFPSTRLVAERARLSIAIDCARGHHDQAQRTARTLRGIRPPDPICPETDR